MFPVDLLTWREEQWPRKLDSAEGIWELGCVTQFPPLICIDTAGSGLWLPLPIPRLSRVLAQAFRPSELPRDMISQDSRWTETHGATSAGLCSRWTGASGSSEDWTDRRSWTASTGSTSYSSQHSGRPEPQATVAREWATGCDASQWLIRFDGNAPGRPAKTEYSPSMASDYFQTVYSADGQRTMHAWQDVPYALPCDEIEVEVGGA